MQKTCKSCGRTMDVSNFYKSKNIKDGYENKCKACRNAQRKKYTKVCKKCGVEFETINKTQQYCSLKCSGISKRNRVKTKCSYCGEQIEVIKSKIKKFNNFYCNQKCRTKHLEILMKGTNNPNYKREKYKCDGCDKEILIPPFQIETQKYIFCSNECYKKNIGKYQRGQNNPSYNRIKTKCSYCGKAFYKTPSTISDNNFCSTECKNEALIKRNKENTTSQEYNCDFCGKVITVTPYELKNKKHIYCSKKCQNKGWGKYYSGKNNPQYDHTKTDEERINGRNIEGYKEWRQAVFERDNYTCQCCGDNKGGNLNAHHIYNYMEYPELRISIDNAITFCEDCHKLFHTTYGYTGNNEKQLKSFLNKYSRKQAL